MPTFLKDMKGKNRQEYSGSRDEVIAMVYNPCKRCNPQIMSFTLYHNRKSTHREKFRQPPNVIKLRGISCLYSWHDSAQKYFSLINFKIHEILACRLSYLLYKMFNLIGSLVYTFSYFTAFIAVLIQPFWKWSVILKEQSTNTQKSGRIKIKKPEKEMKYSKELKEEALFSKT